MVALVTDRVFADEMMLKTSVGIVGLTAAGLAFLFALGLPRLYAAARRAALETPAEAAPARLAAVAG
jgi:hypothetical protein